ncbi:hypothetical protein [Parvibaculum sp.]|uniref:hypothetical protein n=1 Tax=Parvibaculum sp. TaxID=2024848 RepID=UPI00391D3E9D
MAISRQQEARALDKDEQELVEKSHHPALQDLSDKDLAGLVKLLRERRDKARDRANQRRREMRGKAAPRGAAPSAADDGSKIKLAVLAMAMRRLNKETERRRRMAASSALIENAQRALALKKASGKDDAGFNSRHSRRGMRKVANPKQEKLVRPMETGRQRKAASVAQAKRDSR